MPRSHGYTFLLTGAFIWTLLIIVQPLLMVYGIQPAGIILEYFFSPICHQQAARSLHLLGYPLPVCERCAGIYFSFLVTVALFYTFPPRLQDLGKKPSFLVLLLVPVVADYILNLTGLWENSTASRIFSAAIAGAALALVVVPSWTDAFTEIHVRYSSTFTQRRRTRDG